MYRDRLGIAPTRNTQVLDDTLTWGASGSIVFPLAFIPAPQPQQLVRARRLGADRSPTTWTAILTVDAQNQPGEAADIFVVWEVTLGVGSTISKVRRKFTMLPPTPPATSYDQLFAVLTVPSVDMQGTIEFTPAVIPSVADINAQFTMLVAPQVY